MNEVYKVINNDVHYYQFKDKWKTEKNIHGFLGGGVEVYPIPNSKLEQAISKAINFLLKNNEPQYEKLFLYARFQYIGIDVRRILSYIIDCEMSIGEIKIEFTKEIPIPKMNQELLQKAIIIAMESLDIVEDDFLLELCIYHTKNLINRSRSF
jgi:hypothetical protein